MLFLKKPLCAGNLLPARKIFIERPENTQMVQSERKNTICKVMCICLIKHHQRYFAMIQLLLFSTFHQVRNWKNKLTPQRVYHFKVYQMMSGVLTRVTVLALNNVVFSYQTMWIVLWNELILFSLLSFWFKLLLLYI